MSINITYWKVRGRVSPIIHLLRYTQQLYTYTKVEDATAYFTSKPALKESGLQFPNLPYLTHNDTKISESWAILAYVAAQVQGENGHQLLPEYGQLIDFFLYKGIVSDITEDLGKLCYQGEDVEDVKENYENYVDRKMSVFKQLDKHLESSKWLLGDHLTIVDFVWAETLDKIFVMEEEFNLEIVSDLGYLKAYFNKFIELPEVKKFRESDDFMKRPFHYPPLAKWC
jgi:glutathione S-transferase